MDNHDTLAKLIAARHPCLFISTYEEAHVLGLIDRFASDTSADFWLWKMNGGLRVGWLAEASDPATGNAAAALYELSQKRGDRNGVTVFIDLVQHLEDARTLRLLRDAIEQHQQGGETLILLDHSDKLPAVIGAYATRHEVALPDETQLRQIVRDTLKGSHRKAAIKIKATKRDMSVIVKNLRGLNRRQAAQIIADTVAEDRQFTADDINHVLAAKRHALRSDGLLEYIETPTDLSQVGGIRRLKLWLEQRQLSDSDSAVAFGLSAPRGVLLLGVQGAGKSLCAKAIATAWQRPLLRLDPGALYDRYVGESERRLRASLHQAETMAPTVVWIDEIEKGFASAASRSTDGGLSQRMFGRLLTWMQDHEEPVFLVATANDIEALPPELLRKGRFDEIFFVDLPTVAARREIFKIHLSKRGREPDKFDLNTLIEATRGYSGAEIEQGIVAALHEAFAEKTDIDTRRVLKTLSGSPPLSITMAERVGALRRWAQGRCVPADGRDF